MNFTPHYWRPDLEEAHARASGTTAAGPTVRTGDTSPFVATTVAAESGHRASQEDKFDMDKTTPEKTKQTSSRNVTHTPEHEVAKECSQPLVHETAKYGCNTACSQKDKTATVVGSWTYQVIGDNKVGIRKEPCIKAEPNGHLQSGSIFIVSDRICGTDGRMYLKLADGRGWTYDHSAKDPTKVVVMELSVELEKALFVGAKTSGKGNDKGKRKRKADAEEKLVPKKARPCVSYVQW